jgi:hypothetical protein
MKLIMSATSRWISKVPFIQHLPTSTIWLRSNDLKSNKEKEQGYNSGAHSANTTGERKINVNEAHPAIDKGEKTDTRVIF